MALYVLFENKNTSLFSDFISLLFNLQMCQIIQPDPVQCFSNKFLTAEFAKLTFLL